MTQPVSYLMRVLFFIRVCEPHKQVLGSLTNLINCSCEHTPFMVCCTGKEAFSYNHYILKSSTILVGSNWLMLSLNPIEFNSE